MITSRWILISLFASVAALLALLVFPAELGDTGRTWAAALCVTIALLFLLYVRISSSVRQALLSATAQAEKRLTETERNSRSNVDSETARRARSEFVATMSHEVRTPMSAILGMTDLLDMTALTRKQSGYVRIIQSSGNLLLSLVDNMLDFSQLGSGSLSLRKEAFHVTDLLERTLEVMGYQAYSKGIELGGCINHDPSLRVIGDGQRMRQILVNLVGNAIKFTEHGQVIVDIAVDEADRGQARLTVAVSDSGVGMSEDVQKNIFKPLARAARDQVAGGPQGSGLGLAISKQLIELMGGELNVDSAKGKGTTVSFTVPVEIVGGMNSESTSRTPALNRRRVFVANGNRAIAGAISRCLEASGIDCVCTADAAGVVAQLEQSIASRDPCECAIIDADLHESNGLDLARTIRANQALAELPIVLLTSIAKPLEVGEISAIGGIRCVNKPVLPSELRHHLFRSLNLDHPDPPARAELQRHSTLRVLVAEDNPISRKVLTGMLTSLDHDVDCVGDGPAVLRAVEDIDYDLILMDCQMPGMDGDQVTRRIREDDTKAGRQPVVIAITADVSPEHQSRCLKAGMDDFLAKPVRLDTLSSALATWSSMIWKSGDDHIATPHTQGTLRVEDLSAHLMDRVGPGSGGEIGEYIDLFLTDTDSRLEILRAALERRDLITIRRETHALKGACLELGVSEMGRCCDLLREACREERLDALPDVLQALNREFERVRPVFDAARNAPA